MRCWLAKVCSPPASAGCVHGGSFISKYGGPLQSDGTWERCVAVFRYVPSGLSSHLVPVNRCEVMGPGHQYPPADFDFVDLPTRIEGPTP
nr:hypothetical protein [Mycobacterium sp. UM_Kg1]